MQASGGSPAHGEVWWPEEQTDMLGMVGEEPANHLGGTQDLLSSPGAPVWSCCKLIQSLSVFKNYGELCSPL